jgi:site-specific DNA-methyltransferase (adenine-specific)
MTSYYDKDGITLYCGDLRDVLPQLTEKVDHVCTDPPYSLGFMGKAWDKALPGPDYWRIIGDACKPGAMLMAFGGTRTFHRLTCAIEDAGWEIRDCLMWLYGSGFPKAQDIGKMIDKKGADGSAWTGFACALKPAWEPIVLAMKALDGTIAHNALTHGVAGMNIDAGRIETNENLNGGAYAANPTDREQMWGEDAGNSWRRGEAGEYVQPSGRWPANVLLTHHPDCKQIGIKTLKGDQRGDCGGTRPSGFANVGADAGSGEPNARVYGNEEVPAYECHPDCPVGLFPDAPGQLAASIEDGKEQGNRVYGSMKRGGPHHVPRIEGTKSASRFFYCAKASRKERGEGNAHPTVKPLELMKYLLTLLSTPTGGVILDPFAGSGTTLLAAKALGRRCIGIELEPTYCDIIVSRLEAR